MSKTIIPQKHGKISLYDLEAIIDISQIKYYSIKFKKNNTVFLKFYDKKKKLVRPYE